MNNLVKTVALLGLAVVGLPTLNAQQNTVPANAPQNAEPARPGSINYVEGSVLLDGGAINARSVGNMDVDAGQILSTAQGKAEMLLTPGVYLRLDDNSAVKMISPDLAQTQVEVTRGKAGVEVDEIFKQNNIQVAVYNVSTRLLKDGYYEFNAGSGAVMVYRGDAAIELPGGRTRELKDHHQFTLSELNDGGKPLNKEKPVSFDANNSQDELYNWSSLRSEYLAEANNQIAGDYAGGPGFYPGWYWDPWLYDYTFIGLDPFFSPFGWGFYPFGWYGWGGYPGWGWYGGRGWYGGHPLHTPMRGTPGLARGFAGSGSGGAHGGFAGGGFAGGGFAGGFHGGGFGGGLGGGRR
jgi:hypothetical protein